MLPALLLLLAQHTPTRAEQNFVGVMNGSIVWERLSPAERAEVSDVALFARKTRPPRQNLRDRCMASALGRNPGRLDRAIADLKCSQR